MDSVNNIVQEERFVSKWIGIDFKFGRVYQDYLNRVDKDIHLAKK